MQINGTSTIIPHGLESSEQAVKLAAKNIRKVWLEAVKGTKDDGEFFVFKNPAARDAFERDGATEKTLANMIQLVGNENGTVTAIYNGNRFLINSIQVELWCTRRD